MSKHRYLVFGFQGSGKTTFAAALWHLLDGNEIPTSLKKGRHQGDYRYLEEIAQLWGEGWEVDRTKRQQVEAISINLRHLDSGTEFTLEFTDLSGESFEEAIVSRLCSPKLIELVQEAEGILLFVSADRVIDHVTILDAVGSYDKDEAHSSDDDAVDSAQWNPAETPLQVKIVDLLESFRKPPFSVNAPKVAIIVSAWDLSDETSPEEWLKKRMALLYQYIQNSANTAGVRLYGVSAQGGQLSKKGSTPGRDREKLLSMTPSKRIQIVGKNVKEHDLTAPILWLSGLESGG